MSTVADAIVSLTYGPGVEESWIRGLCSGGYYEGSKLELQQHLTFLQDNTCSLSIMCISAKTCSILSHSFSFLIVLAKCRSTCWPR